MDRSRRQGTQRAPSDPPAASRLTVRAKPNRRRAPTTPLWSRLPKPAVVANACGRLLRRSLPALIGLAVIGAIGGTAWAGYRFVTTSARFAISAIEVRGSRAVADLGGLYLVDANGRPFKHAELDETAGLPIITGLDRTAFVADPTAAAHTLASALSAQATWNSGQPPAIADIHVDLHGALTLHTSEQATAIQIGTMAAGLAARLHTIAV